MSLKTTLTPNGTGILFRSHSPRGYWIHQNFPASPKDVLDPPPKKNETLGPWGKRLDSVTGALGVLDKPALPWWGMETGFDAILELVRRGELSITRGPAGTVTYTIHDDEKRKIVDEAENAVTDAKRIAKLATLNKLTVNHIRDNAGDRGLNAHSAFETWAETGIFPAVDAFPEDQRGYVTGLIKFFDETTLSHVQTEVGVASRTHQYGGRYDIRAKITNKRYDFLDVPSILDLKTSKRVYVGHFLQMEGYEGASVECGWKPSDMRAVVHCANGDYTIVRSQDVSEDGEPCTFDDFLAVLRVKRVVERLGGL